MSNIIKGSQDLLMLKDFMKEMQKNDLDKSLIEVILENLLPSNYGGDLLVEYRVSEKGNTAGIFIPEYNLVKVSVNRMKDWLNNNAKDLAEFYNIEDELTLKHYLFLFILTHEIEHSYQYLMGIEKIESPCKLVQAGYKNIFDLLLTDHSILPRPIKKTRKLISTVLYKKNEERYVLERNANIESLDLLCKYALYSQDEEFYELFSDMKNSFTALGYLENTIGSMEETYRKIFMYDKFKKINNQFEMNMSDRVQYGLGIDEETRNKVLSLARKKDKSL